MVGRAIRPNTTRDEPSVILLPVYLAPGEDPAQVVARSDFSGVVQTMTAMRDMDETLDAYFADAVEPWGVTYQKVAAHTTETGALPSPDDGDLDTARLGRWCIRQAVAVDLDATTPPGKRRLTGPQTAKVLALPGFAAVNTTDVDWTGRRRADTDGQPPVDFDLPDEVGGQVAARLAEAIHLHVVEAFTDGYDTGLAYLRAYIAQEGHTAVPLRFVTDDGFRLGTWVHSRRTDYTIGRLTAVRVLELTALGMIWSPLDVGYRTGVAHLEVFVARVGHAAVPIGFVSEDGFTLGTWVSNRRMNYRAGKLTAARVAELTALGMVWSSRDSGYQSGVNHLRAYIAQEGHANVPDRFVTDDGFRLGTWVRSRRTDYTIGSLIAARVAELNELGMVWDSLDSDYQAGVAHLRVFAAREGHANVPARFVTDDGFRLGSWVSNRRMNYRAGKLTAARVTELNELGMVWDSLDSDYQAGLVCLQAFATREGFAAVPARFVTGDGFRLGYWVRRRRVDYRSGKLTAARIAELNALGMVWGTPHTDSYRTGVNYLRAYIAQEGHANVPRRYVTDDGVTLGNWVATRRRDCRAGKLTAARIAELNALGMVWDPRVA